MTDWRTDPAPRDGRWILAAWPGELPRLLRCTWIDQDGRPYAAPLFLDARPRGAEGTPDMTEAQKRAAIASLLERAKAADKRGLFATGKSWRDQAYTLAMRKAEDVVLSRDLGDFECIDAGVTP